MGGGPAPQTGPGPATAESIAGLERGPAADMLPEAVVEEEDEAADGVGVVVEAPVAGSHVAHGRAHVDAGIPQRDLMNLLSVPVFGIFTMPPMDQPMFCKTRPTIRTIKSM